MSNSAYDPTLRVGESNECDLPADHGGLHVATKITNEGAVVVVRAWHE